MMSTSVPTSSVGWPRLDRMIVPTSMRLAVTTNETTMPATP